MDLDLIMELDLDLDLFTLGFNVSQLVIGCKQVAACKDQI